MIYLYVLTINTCMWMTGARVGTYFLNTDFPFPIAKGTSFESFLIPSSIFPFVS